MGRRMRNYTVLNEKSQFGPQNRVVSVSKNWKTFGGRFGLING